MPTDSTDRRERIPALRVRLVGLRDKLRAEIASARGDLATPVEGRGEDLTPSQHPADVAGDLERREDLVAEELLEASQLDAVEGALARMREGTYGACIDCGAAIPLERLEAIPEAARCAACQRHADTARSKGPKGPRRRG